MPIKIPSHPVIYPVLVYPQDFRKSLLRYPKYIDKFSAESYSLSHYSKILSRAKIRHHFDVQEVSMSNSELMKTVTKLSARSKKTCKDIQAPSRMSISLNKLKTFNNLQSIYLKGNLKARKHLYNLKVTDLVYKAPMIADRESKEIVFTKHNRINYISFHVRWNVESMSNLRRTAQKISQIPTLQKAALKIEEIDMCVYLHSFHSLAFWAKLTIFIVTIDTWESLGGAIEYANKMTNLKRFRIETGPRFVENAVKKQYYSLDVVSKFGNFPALETLEMAFDFRGLIQQSIEFLLNMKYPKSLLCLDEKLMLPDIDTLVQKMNKSLSLTTYLSVENQSPFKEFIKNHESLGSLKKFRSELVTKQMMGSHSKLYRGLLTHMKVLEEVDITIYAQQAKPFLYLGIYNLLVMGDKVKKLSLHIEPSYVDFSGSELLEVENKLSGLREMRISCPGERFTNEKVQSFFRSTIQKQIEEINLDFIQEVTDQELEKRFMLLGKCNRLKKMLLRFKVRDFSDVSLEKIWEVIMRSQYLEVVDLELEGAEIDKRDMERMRQYAEIKRRIRKLKIKATNYKVIKEEGSTLCILESVGTMKSEAYKA